MAVGCLSHLVTTEVTVFLLKKVFFDIFTMRDLRVFGYLPKAEILLAFLLKFCIRQS